ncbi:MAG: hypothetical protein Q4F99_02300 [bacterium]|nr:hypothetical protein [bacterium]
MKSIIAVLAFVLLCCVGCFGSRIVPPCYTVGLDEVLSENLAWPAVTDVKVSLARDLQSMTVPFVYHSDGRVTNYKKLTYYASLPAVLERAIEDHVNIQAHAKQSSQLHLMLTDYKIDLRGKTPMVVVQFKTHLMQTPSGFVLKHPSDMVYSLKGTCELPKDYSVQDVRKAFAIALKQACSLTK